MDWNLEFGEQKKVAVVVVVVVVEELKRRIAVVNWKIDA